jgi:hypothetical protein
VSNAIWSDNRAATSGARFDAAPAATGAVSVMRTFEIGSRVPERMTRPSMIPAGDWDCAVSKVRAMIAEILIQTPVISSIAAVLIK